MPKEMWAPQASIVMVHVYIYLQAEQDNVTENKMRIRACTGAYCLKVRAHPYLVARDKISSAVKNHANRQSPYGHSAIRK